MPTTIFAFFLLVMTQCQTTGGSGAAPPDFRSQLAKGEDVFVENQEIAGDVDFTAVAPGQLVAPGNRRVNVRSAVTFRKCRFKGKVTGFRMDSDGTATACAFGRNLSFIECTFEGEVNFRANAVADLACFSGCVFMQKASFEDADFQNHAWFGQSRFEDEGRFQNANFRRKADFFKAEFSKACSFQGGFFASDAQFGGLKSYKYADFSLAQFSGHVFFNYAELHGQALFDNAWFKGRSEFISTKFVTASFKEAWFLGQTRFNKSLIDQSLDLAGLHVTGEQPDWTGVDQARVKNRKE
jgi:uncharacterized protein YjbI with pentapeptide repeats